MRRFIRSSLIGILIMMYLEAKYPELIWYKAVLIMMGIQLVYMALLETKWER